MIPDKYNDLADSVEKVIQFSQHYESSLPGVPYLISIWRKNKSRFYDLFGKKLIWEVPFSIELTAEMKQDMLTSFIAKIENKPKFCEDEDFIPWLKANTEEFFNNKVTSPHPDFSMKKGDKLLKAFKYFFEENQEQKTHLRELQDLASQLIQVNKLEGTLCLSIHPLDYLTLSDNNANWTSCHSLHGSYRAGNLSYMLDKTTIICYLKSNNNVQLKNFPEGLLWNNKKWRMLISISENNYIAFFNNQYPFSNDEIRKYVLHTAPLEKLKLGYIQKGGFNKIVDGRGCKVPLFHNFIYLGSGGIMDTKKICPSSCLIYSDIIYSRTYTPVFSVSKTEFWHSEEEDLITPIGEDVPCPAGCGELLTNSEKLLCPKCHRLLKTKYNLGGT